jgi:protein ImuA
MISSKTSILAELQREISLLQGFKRPQGGLVQNILPRSINKAFPGGEFPYGAVHEFCYSTQPGAAATGGFISVILHSLIKTGGACIWISPQRSIFPPALQAFGIAPEKIIFIEVQKERDIRWVIEEALKCEGLGAVVGEIRELNFTDSRRLQLAVEHSHVTGFLLRDESRNLNTTACVSRWKVTPHPSALPEGMPGVGFPRWKVELFKIRNGTPGKWIVEYTPGHLEIVDTETALHIIQEPQKKTG